ncbi:MAG: phosphatidylglycerophosphatase A [Bacteroidota bacterium]
MIHLAKAIASVCGIGYINNGRGAGTVASLVFCIVWFLIPSFLPGTRFAFLIIVLSAGVWSSTMVERIWGKDNNKVVIDEVAGMMIVLLFIPAEIKYILTALILFRFFDIVKPLGIKKLELLPSGWGVMADDIVAGIYSLIIMRIILLLNLF